jgi:hypothetical protein
VPGRTKKKEKTFRGWLKGQACNEIRKQLEFLDSGKFHFFFTRPVLDPDERSPDRNTSEAVAPLESCHSCRSAVWLECSWRIKGTTLAAVGWIVLSELAAGVLVSIVNSLLVNETSRLPRFLHRNVLPTRLEIRPL